MRTYSVYIMASPNNGVLYIGVTNDLVRRVWEHKNNKGSSFTTRYNCVKLVYYEDYNNISTAIEREKNLKNWKRSWKDELIYSVNPDMRDLSEDW